jgi:rhodanese-related sulfurtransferase
MDHLIPFIHDNLLLVIPFLVILTVYLAMEMRHRDAANISLSPQLTVLKMNQKNCQIIDIRDKESFQKAHIVNAKPYDAPLKDFADSLQKHKANPIVVICNTGVRAKEAALLLKKQKFEHVFVLAGGMTAWKKENMPVVSGKK